MRTSGNLYMGTVKVTIVRGTRGGANPYSQAEGVSAEDPGKLLIDILDASNRMIRNLNVQAGVHSRSDVTILVCLASVIGMVYREEGFTRPIVIKWPADDEESSPNLAIQTALRPAMEEFLREYSRGLRFHH